MGFKVLFLLLIILSSPLSASILDEKFDLESLKGKKIGYYIGSFDPIHRGHQNVIGLSLEHYVDYVLIYPVPGGDCFKNRTNLADRQKMIASIYHEDPRVFYTYWTPKELQDNFLKLGSAIEIVGIVGSDVVTESLLKNEKHEKIFMRGITLTEKHSSDTIGALMALKADSFLVSQRGDIDLSFLNGIIGDRPIRAFLQSGEISSTQIRRAIKEQKPFEQDLAASVYQIIQEEGFYQ